MVNNMAIPKTFEPEFEESIAEKQAEYTQLLTQYRVMQGDRQAYGTESQKLISKQRAEITALEMEKAELLENLKQAGSISNQRKDERYCEDLANIADNRDWVENQITEQKITQQQLDTQIREAEDKVHELKILVGGTYFNYDYNMKMKHKTARLESRLDHASKKYNLLLANNQEIRTKIDHQRIERARFDVIYKKLDRKLTDLRRQNAELIESTTQAFHIREESQARMTALKEKSQKDSVAHNAEMKELIREIDHERKLAEFMYTKTAERKEDPQLVAWKAKKAKEATEKKEAHQETTETYELAFQQMSHLTKEEDVDSIINVFHEREDENFSLFGYIHELRGLQEELMEQIEKLKSEVQNNNDMEEKNDELNEKKLDALDEVDDTADDNVQTNKLRLQASYSMLELLTRDIKSLFNLIGADRSSLDAKLASTDEISTYNVIEYLRLVEVRMIELLRVANYIALRDSDAPYDVRQCLMGTGPAVVSSAPKIIPPTLTDDFGIPDPNDPSMSNAVAPMTREEMKAVVMQTVRRKEQEALAKPNIDSVSHSNKEHRTTLED